MKKLLLSVFIIFSVFQSNAQTKVIKMSATKSTDYGVQYFLPKTILSIEVNYSKITQKAGPFAKYAERYLGLGEEAVIGEDKVYYTLDKISVESFGIPDKSESYLVEFKAKTTSPFVYLTEDGLICAINADYTVESVVGAGSGVRSASGSSVINSQSVYTEEYIRAGSVNKMAEVAAKQIYKIRESRNDILTGEAENVPRDGEGIKIVLANLEAQEKALVALFTGTTQTEFLDSEFEVEPLADIDKEVLFRFSKYNGLVDAEDLSGSPVYINVKSIESVKEEIVDPKRKAKEPQSIVYKIPGKAAVEIFHGVNLLYNNTFQVVQFGSNQILATSLFDDKKAPVKVYFYPNTGAIKQIVQ
ncbi:MAG: DUF4831 family protein [Dysgonamonadaceae bacterium]|jgi:hypothetical protein|nr:DUF4831 family protein [Dysgonamonadaceae bacterium]